MSANQASSCSWRRILHFGPLFTLGKYEQKLICSREVYIPSAPRKISKVDRSAVHIICERKEIELLLHLLTIIFY